MCAFKDKVLKDVDQQLGVLRDDYLWIKDNTCWPNVACSDSLLAVYGADLVPLADYGKYLQEKLKDAVLEGLTYSDVNAAIQDVLSSIKYAAESHRIITFSSMETHGGGRLRATVAIVLVRKANPNTLASVVYKAIYDITAKDDCYWRNSKNHLEKSKGWAQHKALEDFRKNHEKLLIHLRDPGIDSVISTHSSVDQVLNSF